MSFRFGLTFLFGLSIVLMQEKVAYGAAGDLDDVCQQSPAVACTDSTNVCDINQQPQKCRMKHGTDCSSGNKCVDGATCSTATPPLCACDSHRTATTEGLCAVELAGDCTGGKICSTGLICSNNVCSKVALNGDCTGGKTCDTGLVCQSNVCSKVALNGDCTGGKTCDTGLVCLSNVCSKVGINGDCSGGKTCNTSLVCQNNQCKITNGSSCASHINDCVQGAACNSTTNLCACGTGNTPATADGQCAGKVGIGGNCNGGKTCDTDLVCQGDACKILSGKSCTGHTGNCVDGASCNTTNLCECGSGRTPALVDGKCSDAKSGTKSLKDLLSLVLVMAAFVMSSTV